MTAPVLHLSIPVQDLVEARAFYLDVLGCRPGRVRASGNVIELKSYADPAAAFDD